MRRTGIQEHGEASQVADDERRRPEHGGIAEELLALQRSAGNRAVGSLLARDPTKEKGGGGHADDKVPKGPVQATATFPDPIGSVPVESLEMKGVSQVAILVPIDPSTPKLLEYAQNGTLLATVVIEVAGSTITMEQVMIAGAQQTSSRDGGPGSVYLTLDFRERQIKYPEDEAEKDKPQPGWGERDVQTAI